MIRMPKVRGRSLVRSLIWIAVLAVVIAAGVWAVVRFTTPTLSVTEAVEGPVVQAFYATGTVEPVKEYPIRANLAAILTEVTVDKGDRVTKGQVVARVTDPEMRFRHDQALADLEEKRRLADEKTSPALAEFETRIVGTRELLAIAERERDRVARLIENNAASPTDLDRAMDRVQELRTTIASLEAQRERTRLQLQKDVAVAEAALKIAQWNLDQQNLVSPIDGVVLDRPLAQGTRVAVNDTVMTVADVQPDNLVMRAAVDEEDINFVKIDQLVRMTLYAFPGQAFEGKVERIYDQADQTRRTFEVDVRLSQPMEQLLPGMTGELAFILAERQRAVIIPAQAIQGDSVWIVRSGRLERISPRIGIRSIERAEVLEGLPPGAQVVIDPIGDLEEGRQVRTRRVDPIVAAGLNTPEIEEQPFSPFN